MLVYTKTKGLDDAGQGARAGEGSGRQRLEARLGRSRVVRIVLAGLLKGGIEALNQACAQAFNGPLLGVGYHVGCGLGQ